MSAAGSSTTARAIAPPVGARWPYAVTARRRRRTAPGASDAIQVRERVAAVRVAGLPAGREPLLALGGRAVRPRLRIHAALRLLLDPVVADGRGGAQRILHVGGRHLRQVAGLLRVVRPDAGEAVGLQLGLHRRAVLHPAGRCRSCRACRESWTWWPYSCASTYACASGPVLAPNRVRSSSRKPRSM